jgi:hypothetical protein
MFQRGDFIILNSDVGVVVMNGVEMEGDLDDHTMVWFGEIENGLPVTYTVPTDYLKVGPAPEVRH